MPDKMHPSPLAKVIFEEDQNLQKQQALDTAALVKLHMDRFNGTAAAHRARLVAHNAATLSGFPEDA